MHSTALAKAQRPDLIGNPQDVRTILESTEVGPDTLSGWRFPLLRNEARRLSDDVFPPRLPPAKLTAARSDPQLFTSRTHGIAHMSPLATEDPWQLPPLPLSRSCIQVPQGAAPSKPKPSLVRLSSLDNLLRYREEKAEWKRSSSILQQGYSTPASCEGIMEPEKVPDSSHEMTGLNQDIAETSWEEASAVQDSSSPSIAVPPKELNRFRHSSAEAGFCFTIAMTQLLAEYLISGFAIELTHLLAKSRHPEQSQSSGIFWPASLLPLILSATLLIFARISDMYGGYFPFMLGLAWLTVWTLIPGFCTSIVMLDVARAMQGLAIAAFMPSTFAMVGSIYSEGPRKNFILGLYSGCAPVGFFVGLSVAAALPEEKMQWYFWIASALSGITLVAAFLSVPSDRTDRRRLGLKMDWIGSFSITSGLILLSYALSAEPYASRPHLEKSDSGLPIVIGLLVAGLGLLGLAFWYEGWCAKCPLLPFDFFGSRSVTALSLAGLCFYATFGAWLYNSAQFFQSPEITANSHGVETSGMNLALWYLPTAVGGLVLCVVGGSLLHVVPIMILLVISSLAWIAAPLLLALAPLPLNYWKYVFPSMLCATIGIDLTFTVSIVFVSSVQPLKYQGLAGGLCSILVNMGLSFGLAISAILHPSSGMNSMRAVTRGFRAAFLYAAVSAAVGLIICAMFVRISRSIVRRQRADGERDSNRSELTPCGNGELHEPMEDV